MNLSLENYMVMGETLFRYCVASCGAERRGAVAMAHHCYEDHGATIDVSEKFKLKNFYIAANVLYYAEDNTEAGYPFHGEKIGNVVFQGPLPNAGDVRALLERSPVAPVERPVYLECPRCHGDYDIEYILLTHWEQQHSVDTDVRVFVKDCLIREPDGVVVGIYKFRSLLQFQEYLRQRENDLEHNIDEFFENLIDFLKKRMPKVTFVYLDYTFE